MDKLKSRDKKQNRGIIRKLGEGNSNGERRLRTPRTLSESGAFRTVEVIPEEEFDESLICSFESGHCTSRSLDPIEMTVPIVTKIMEALADPSIHIIGIRSASNATNGTLLQTIRRRIKRDMVFDKVLKADVTEKSDVKRIQEEIAGQLGLDFNEKSKGRRAGELLDRIKNENKILIILCDLYKRLDLGRVGIPFGASHGGCKILLTSPSEEVLSSHMNTQKNFMV